MTDIAAGAKQRVDSGEFNTVPAMSDESMGVWMQYIYMQKPKPSSATGVAVHLTAIDPNNNIEDLGNATTDSSGLYSLLWTPPVPGKYIITATFEGSASYWPSSSETAIGVTKAASPAVTPTTVPTVAPTQIIAPPTSTPAQTSSSPSPAVAPPESGVPTTTYIAIVAAVIVIAVIAAAIVLRRRK